MFNQNSVNLRWKLGLTVSLFQAVLLLGNPACGQTQSIAQSSNITADNSLGNESSQIIENVQIKGLSSEAITGGVERGINLFHSFQEFNVSEGRGAYFVSPNADIQNILARVTGGNPSEILGTLGVNGNSPANLFLINPNGILFGEKASLDVTGSFVGTTADAVQFGEQGFFSATEPETSSLLSVEPSALFFNAVNNQIAAIQHNGFLRVPIGKSLLLIGGNVSFNGGSLFAPGGRVELGGLTETGTVGIAINDNNISLDFSADSSFSNINLTNDARVNVRGTGRGDIFVRANNFTATGGGRLVAGTEGIDKAGDIFVTANNISLSGESTNASSGIYNQALPGSLGDAGNILINSRAFTAASGATIKTNSAGTGNSGNVEISSADSVKLTDSNIETITSDSSTGNAGNITITTGAYLASGANGYLWSGTAFNGRNAGNISLNTDSVNLDNGSSIDSSNRFGFGNAGTVEINATQDINFSGDSFIDSQSSLRGNGGRVSIESKGLVSLINSSIFTNALLGSNGKAGDINIEANSLSMTDASELAASGFEEARAGNIAFQTIDFVNLDNSKISVISSTQAGGNIFLETNQLKLNNGSILFASVLGNQSAGNIYIKATELVEVNDSSKLSIDTTGNGNAGSLTINTKKLTVRNGSKVSSSALGGNGRGGNLLIDASDAVEVTGATPNGITSSGIETDTGGTGTAGNINIITGKLIVRDGSRVSSFTTLGSTGKGGFVDVKASESVEVSGIRPSLLAASSLDSSSDGTGTAGDIKVSTGKLILREGGKVAASTSGLGSGGNLDIEATDLIDISGQLFNGFYRSGIFAQSQPVFTEVANQGGNIKVKTPSLDISNGGQINARAFGIGNAGNINIIVDNLLNMRTGDISTSSTQSSGGSIQIKAENIRLFDDSNIRSNVANGEGGGGNITLTADTIVALDDSDILSFARDGKGGDINFNTQAFLSEPLFSNTPPISDREILNSLNTNNQVDVNASGAVSGAITGVPDITFIENSLSDLQQNPIDTNALIANSCIARSRKQESTFNITGAGGLPQRPGDAAASNYPTGEVQNLSDKIQSSEWKPGEAIVEAQGVYELPSGKLILSRECS